MLAEKGIRCNTGAVPAAVNSTKLCAADTHWETGKGAREGMSQKTCLEP